MGSRDRFRLDCKFRQRVDRARWRQFRQSLQPGFTGNDSSVGLVRLHQVAQWQPGVVSFPLHSALRTPNLKPSIWPASSISSATLNSERPAPTATKPINSARTGPTRWQRLHTTFPVAKPDSVLAPIPAVGDRLKLLLEQRMIGMHYSDRSLVSVPLWRI